MLSYFILIKLVISDRDVKDNEFVLHASDVVNPTQEGTSQRNTNVDIDSIGAKGELNLPFLPG